MWSPKSDPMCSSPPTRPPALRSVVSKKTPPRGNTREEEFFFFRVPLLGARENRSVTKRQRSFREEDTNTVVHRFTLEVCMCASLSALGKPNASFQRVSLSHARARSFPSPRESLFSRRRESAIDKGWTKVKECTQTLWT